MNNHLTGRVVPRQEFVQLESFRATHPVKHAILYAVRWEYIASGHGSEALLILPGLLGIGEMSFQHIQAFENDSRVIGPSYPFELTTVDQMADGIAAILDTEGIRQAHVLGGIVWRDGGAVSGAALSAARGIARAVAHRGT